MAEIWAATFPPSCWCRPFSGGHSSAPLKKTPRPLVYNGAARAPGGRSGSSILIGFRAATIQRNSANPWRAPPAPFLTEKTQAEASLPTRFFDLQYTPPREERPFSAEVTKRISGDVWHSRVSHRRVEERSTVRFSNFFLLLDIDGDTEYLHLARGGRSRRRSRR